MCKLNYIYHLVVQMQKQFNSGKQSSAHISDLPHNFHLFPPCKPSTDTTFYDAFKVFEKNVRAYPETAPH